MGQNIYLEYQLIITQLYSKVNSTLSLPKPLLFVIQINTSFSRSNCFLMHCQLIQRKRFVLTHEGLVTTQDFTLDNLT